MFRRRPASGFHFHISAPQRLRDQRMTLFFVYYKESAKNFDSNHDDGSSLGNPLGVHVSTRANLRLYPCPPPRSIEQCHAKARVHRAGRAVGGGHPRLVDPVADAHLRNCCDHCSQQPLRGPVSPVPLLLRRGDRDPERRLRTGVHGHPLGALGPGDRCDAYGRW